jgi:hypothetical protein
VYARLFVAHQYVREIGVLLQGLADARDVAVAENPQHSGEECVLPAIPFHVLILQKAHQRLSHRNATFPCRTS